MLGQHAHFRVKTDRIQDLIGGGITNWICFLFYASMPSATSAFNGKNQTEDTSSQAFWTLSAASFTARRVFPAFATSRSCYPRNSHLCSAGVSLSCPSHPTVTPRSPQSQARCPAVTIVFVALGGNLLAKCS